MKETGAINLFPRMQVKPFDGMSVTAEVWAQAHDEHRQALNAHNLVSHGSGILTGLEVTANDPADQYVFISPGAAVDPAGNIIVVPEAVTYDFGESSEGMLYLVLGKGEREVGGVGSDTRYLQSEFVIAARPTMPKRPAVELARLRYPEDRRSYHVSAEVERIPAIEALADAALPALLDQFDLREALHVTYGSALAKFGPELKGLLCARPEAYDAILMAHFKKHLDPL